MKIDNNLEFKPVTITLESQEELDLFTSIFYRVGGVGMKVVFGDARQVFRDLTKAGGKESFPAYGEIAVSVKAK